MTPRARFALLVPSLCLLFVPGLPAQGEDTLVLPSLSRGIPRAKPTGPILRRVTPASPEESSSGEEAVVERLATPGRGSGDVVRLERRGGGPGGVAMLEQQVEQMEQVQRELGGAFNDYERAHRSALQAARRVLRDYERCHRRIVEQGRFTESQRSMACSSGDSEERCLMKLVEQCIGDEADDYRETQLALMEKGQAVAALLRSRRGERNIAELQELR